jgi:hypothetical protein
MGTNNGAQFFVCFDIDPTFLLKSRFTASSWITYRLYVSFAHETVEDWERRVQGRCKRAYGSRHCHTVSHDHNKPNTAYMHHKEKLLGLKKRDPYIWNSSVDQQKPKREEEGEMMEEREDCAFHAEFEFHRYVIR